MLLRSSRPRSGVVGADTRQQSAPRLTVSEDAAGVAPPQGKEVMPRPVP
jgi:hypothetical protein